MDKVTTNNEAIVYIEELHRVLPRANGMLYGFLDIRLAGTKPMWVIYYKTEVDQSTGWVSTGPPIVAEGNTLVDCVNNLILKIKERDNESRG